MQADVSWGSPFRQASAHGSQTGLLSSGSTSHPIFLGPIRSEVDDNGSRRPCRNVHGWTVPGLHLSGFGIHSCVERKVRSSPLAETPGHCPALFQPLPLDQSGRRGPQPESQENGMPELRMRIDREATYLDRKLLLDFQCYSALLIFLQVL